MKKLSITVLTILLVFSTTSAKAEGFQVPTGVQGMVTGALLGSVFGPSKKVRAKNAVIGAISGLIIGSQYEANQREAHSNDWSNRYPVQHTPKSRVVVYENRQDDSYWQETRIIRSSQYPSNQTIIIKKTRPVVVYQSSHRNRDHNRYYKRERHYNRHYRNNDW
jgi:uncharacterized protein YcfJ